MSILTMAAPSHAIFRNEYHWDTAPNASGYSRSRPETKAVALPSIRQTFPELLLDGPLPDRPTSRTSTIDKSPSLLASPDYVRSPTWNKRRRISIEDEQSTLRAKQVPRLYRSPEEPAPRQLSPSLRDHQASTRVEAWTTANRSDSYQPNLGMAVPVELNARVEPRRGLPGLPPTVKTERQPTKLHHGQEHAASSKAPRLLDRTPLVYQSQDYSYSYQHPGRYQSLSTSSIRPYNRAPFSAGGNYSPNYSDIGRYGDLSGLGGDAKQRKRRGNLPKETTDKLRAWFVAHLQHPYPTEDEKQDLMRQTGLQMSKLPRKGVCATLKRAGTNAWIRSNLQLVHQRASTTATSHDQ